MKVAAPNGDVDTIPAKEWVPKSPPGYAQNFQHDFNTRYYTAQEGYDRVHDLAAQYPNIAKEVKAPEQTWGYMRRAATMVGYQQASYVTFAPLVDPQTGLTLPGAERQHLDSQRGQRRQDRRPAHEGVGP